MIGVLRDVLARLVAIREALIDGDTYFAGELLADLEHDLAATLERHRETV